MTEGRNVMSTLLKHNQPIYSEQHFRRHDPVNSEEFEMMENLFDVLCSALLLPANRDRFLKVRFLIEPQQSFEHSGQFELCVSYVYRVFLRTFHSSQYFILRVINRVKACS